MSYVCLFSVCLYIDLSFCMLCVCLSVYPSVCQSVCLSARLTVCLSFCLYVVYLSIYLSLSICLSVCLSVCQSAICTRHMPVPLSIHREWQHAPTGCAGSCQQSIRRDVRSSIFVRLRLICCTVRAAAVSGGCGRRLRATATAAAADDDGRRRQPGWQLCATCISVGLVVNYCPATCSG